MCHSFILNRNLHTMRQICKKFHLAVPHIGSNVLKIMLSHHFNFVCELKFIIYRLLEYDAQFSKKESRCLTLCIPKFYNWNFTVDLINTKIISLYKGKNCVFLKIFFRNWFETALAISQYLNESLIDVFIIFCKTPCF